MNEISTALKNWVPYKLGGDNTCRWLYLKDKKFVEPFFDETIATCMQLPENSNFIKCVGSIDVLPEWAQQIEKVLPSAFIFHVSRCGSTLISQLLTLQPGNIVLSEVPFFDELLRAGNNKQDIPAALPLLKAAIDIYGTKREEQACRVFIKADSWHIHFYAALRQLYPNIPFILLYRRPDEVLRSQQKKRGMQAIPNLLEADIFGFDKDKIAVMDLDEYMAMVIESYLQAFVEIAQRDKYSYPVNYNEGGLNIVNKIAGLTGMDISETEWQTMKKRSGFHAKNPADVFKEPQLNEPVYPFLKRSFELYDELEKIRTT